MRYVNRQIHANEAIKWFDQFTRLEPWNRDRQQRLRDLEPEPKPEGFWVEIADLMIRIADYVGSRRFRVPGGCFLGTEKDLESIPAVVSGLHYEIGACGFLTAVDTCEHFAAAHKVDLWSIIREKLRYNATRPHRHGGKKA